jgi:formamidopyrimidine-DNA glycosylase
MPELPEIWNLARQMDQTLRGKSISQVEVRQEKCLNRPLEEFRTLLEGKRLKGCHAHGKWVFTALAPEGYFLLSLGMGGSLLYHPAPASSLPEKYQVRLGFQDESALTVGFWWFGYAHAVEHRREHPMTANLGLDPLDERSFTWEAFQSLLSEKKGTIKALLMNQHAVAGIGNVYIQDILFRSRLHPNRKIPTIGDEQRQTLYQVIGENLRQAAEMGGLAYEEDLFGVRGQFKDFLVGYREGKGCPECGTVIQKIKTGSTSTFICPSCQNETSSFSSQ